MRHAGWSFCIVAAVLIAAGSAAGIGGARVAAPRSPQVRLDGQLAQAERGDTAAAGPFIVGPACPDVMVIAARGTGETPLKNWGSTASYRKDPYFGAGSTLYDLYFKLVNARPGLRFSLEPVIYPVPDLSVLKTPGKALADFEPNARTGANVIVADIKRTDQHCGHTVRYVLAGYSEGAWAVHDALYDLEAEADLSKVAGVAMFGDPKFVPGQTIVREYKSVDILPGLAVATDRKDNGVPRVIAPHTGSWCRPLDPVCQVLPDLRAELAALLVCAVGPARLCAHLHYAQGPTSKAATFLAPFLPKKTLFPQLTLTAPPIGAVGMPYKWTATATCGSQCRWTTTTAKLPPGLTLSATGTVNGTPSQAGSYNFLLYATTTHGRTTVGNATITIGGWTAIESPIPVGADASRGVSLGPVACASVSTCAAAGSYTDSSGINHELLLTGSGSSWNATSAPLPGNASAGANSGPVVGSIACPSATECVAVGWYAGSFGIQQGLLLTGSGSSWTAAEAPLPANANATNAEADLTSVACPSKSKCVAVGWYFTAEGRMEGLLLTWTRSSWTATEAPLPANASVNGEAGLASVVCPSASACAAVGWYDDPSGYPHPLLLAGTGSSWKATEGPLPADAGANPDATLGNVACPSVSECVSAGQYTDASGNTLMLVLSGSGASWKATASPLPANWAAGSVWSLSSLACPLVSDCVGVGYYVDTSGNLDALLLTGAGSSWKATAAPLPAGAAANPGAALRSVACPSASECFAVGSYLDVSGQQGLLLTGTGASWSATRALLPANGTSSALLGLVFVACPSSAECVITGDYADTSANTEGMLLTGPG